MLLEIFKTGTHTDSKGRTATFTEDGLDKIVNSYNPEENEAPVVIGHPKDNSPAWGWVKGLKRTGELLMAELKDLAPEFSGWLKENRYKKRSMSLYPDGTLRHIGFLGATPPAVKGLKDVAFSEGEYTEYDYAVHGYQVAGIFQRLREWVIEKFGKEDADKIVSNWEIEDMQRTGEPESTQAFSDTPPGGDNPEEKEVKTMSKTYTEAEFQEALGKKDKEHSGQIASLEEAGKEKNEKIKAQGKELANFKSESRKKELKSFCESLKKEGKLTPAEEKMGMAEFMEALEGMESQEIEFSEGGKKTPANWFKDYLSNRGKVIEFREIAGGEGDIPSTDEAKREKLISDYQEANECDYKTAMLEVSKENPELFTET